MRLRLLMLAALQGLSGVAAQLPPVPMVWQFNGDSLSRKQYLKDIDFIKANTLVDLLAVAPVDQVNPEDPDQFHDSFKEMVEYAKAKDNPVADAFRINAGDFNGAAGRSAWDETAVLAAVRGADSYFNVHRGTYRMIGKDGANEWVPDEGNGPHLRLTEKVKKIKVGKVIDELICRMPMKK